jgi:thymidylate synthase ThyX
MPAMPFDFPAAAPEAEVYAVYGVEPEVQAYAMAKYSRSALSMKESLHEISEQKAEKFLNTFYFQYGHRSIADLAHLAFALERLSILAAIAVVDEPRWDGQERSTRYQDFKKSGYHVPDFGDDRQAAALYRETLDALFREYQSLSETMWQYLQQRVPLREGMSLPDYERTLRARAFDIARYLLPLATNTSLGQIVSARTLEAQIARLLAHTHPEARRLGELLKEAARAPAYNPNDIRYRELVEEAKGYDDGWGRQLDFDILKRVRVAPTLVKYADPSAYEMETRRDLRQAADELMRGAALAPAPAVDLLDDDAVEVELAATLLYQHCHHAYRQIREAVQGLAAKPRDEIVELGTRHRGPHDELLRAYCAGQKFRFDILMDIGAYRDLHRHRRCIQIGQGFTTAHGYETPPDLVDAGLRDRYDALMARAAGVQARLAASSATDAEAKSQYAIPLAYRKRTLFKMDFAEVVYIAELRTSPAGHFSYRRIAWEMYQAVARRHPSLGRYFRVSDPNETVDLLQR